VLYRKKHTVEASFVDPNKVEEELESTKLTKKEGTEVERSHEMKSEDEGEGDAARK
jgi:hypothetical protein